MFVVVVLAVAVAVAVAVAPVVAVVVVVVVVGVGVGVGVEQVRESRACQTTENDERLIVGLGEERWQGGGRKTRRAASRLSSSSLPLDIHHTGTPLHLGYQRSGK